MTRRALYNDPMSTATAPPPARPKAAAKLPSPPAVGSHGAPTTATVLVAHSRFSTAAEWYDSLGNVPMERILFDPWPGTATEADLLRYVQRDKHLCELIDGTLVEKPVGAFEGMIGLRLGSRLLAWSDANKAGYVAGADATLRMASGRVRLPDVVFIARDQLPGRTLTFEPVPTAPPTVAVEVISESNTPAEMAQKLVEYFGSGGRLAWYVYPLTRTVEVYDKPGEPVALLGESDALDGGAVLPGFSVPVADLFVDLPPSP